MTTETRLVNPKNRTPRSSDESGDSLNHLNVPQNCNRNREFHEFQPDVEVVHREREDCCGDSCVIYLWRLVIAIIFGFVVILIKSSSSRERQVYTYEQPTTRNRNNDIFQRIPSTNREPSLFDFSTFGFDTSCIGSVCDFAAGEIIKSLNESVDPCDNFYNFACQGWQQHNPRPEYTEEWSVFNKLDQKMRKVVLRILNEPIVSTELKALSDAKRYFHECVKADTSTDSIQQEREMQFILNKLEEYGGWPILYENETWNSDRFDWMKVVVGLKKEFDSTQFLDVSSYQDLVGNVSKNCIFLNSPFEVSRVAEQDGNKILSAVYMLMAYRDFIVNVVKEFLSFSKKSEFNETYLQEKAIDIIYVQRQLLKLESIQREKGLLGKSEYTVETLQKKIDNFLPFNKTFDILKLLNTFYAGTGIRIKSAQPVKVPNIKYLLAISFYVVPKMNKEDFANYLLYEMAFKMVSLSSVERLKNHVAKLGKALHGVYAEPPRDEVCANKAQKKFPFAVGHEFVKRQNMAGKAQRVFLSELGNSYAENFTKVRRMFINIKQKFSNIALYSLEPYLDKTILQLELFVTSICPGYPPWILQSHRVDSEYTKLNLSTSLQQPLSFLEQTIVINHWTENEKLSKLTQPGGIDECKWKRFPGTVGAFHELFTIYVPLGILQKPFYDDRLPRSLNYGRLGTIMGHEIAHGLVGIGWSMYDDGRSTPVAKCFIDQYNKYSFDDMDINMTVNGVLTLEENLSDNAGLLAAYKAYKANSYADDNKHNMKGLESYTKDQLFYIGFAQNWCETVTEEGMKTLLDSDVHSPGQFRVLGALQNSKEFAKVWKCPVGSKMNPSRVEGKCNVF